MLHHEIILSIQIDAIYFPINKLTKDVNYKSQKLKWIYAREDNLCAYMVLIVGQKISTTNRQNSTKIHYSENLHK